ncbi:hypothetical protein NQ314_003079 [Rhamnusium bicolor]|uniref:Cell cycle checkpoint protein RAD1 n=1 Tax=Rhamnusium bicolor TaxID=1586634 RepID=A0AAV8ZPS6_9CUCU|nr:hypothetical protein NQ314_003079 [Rhamnusium bicolor]
MLFCAEITDYKIVYNVLRSITMKDFAILRPMEEGLKVTLDEMKCVETSAYIPCNMFSFYHIDNNENIMCKINLKTLVEILNIFGDEGNPNLKLTYKSIGSPLCLVMSHEGHITVDCEIRTMNVDNYNDISLADECDLNKMVINANIFAEILYRLDNSADEVKLTLSPDPPIFHFNNYRHRITIFQCEKAVTSNYSFSNIRQILKVMHYANKVAISTGASGLLGLQLVINLEDRQMYVEYYVASQCAA